MALGGDPATGLSLLLSTFLANEAAIPQSLPLILNALGGLAPIAKLEQLAVLAEEQPQNITAGQASALLKKWALRINTLLQSKDEKIRWAAAHFVQVTAEQSSSLFRQHIRSWVHSLTGSINVRKCHYAGWAWICRCSYVYFIFVDASKPILQEYHQKCGESKLRYWCSYL